MVLPDAPINELVDRMEAAGFLFHPGATDDGIRAAQNTLGATFPPEIVALYRRANGMPPRWDSAYPDQGDEYPAFGKFWRLLSLSELTGWGHRSLRDIGWSGPEGVCFWTNDQSDYFRLALSGPLAGRVRHLSHDGEGSSYLYRSTVSFLKAVLAAGLNGFRYSDAPHPDYPPTAPWDPHTTRRERDAVNALWREWEEAARGYDQTPSGNAEERRRLSNAQLEAASAILSLTPFEYTYSLLRLLDDPDFYTQAHTCESLGRRRWTAAIPRLTEVAQQTIPNSRAAAIAALVQIGTPEAVSALHFLADQNLAKYQAEYVRQALKRLEGNEERER